MTRLAVIGYGHLGKIHARLAAASETIDLVAIVDPVSAARESATADLGVAAFSDASALKGRIDAAILATPTPLHCSVGLDLLMAGIHLLIEKPLAVGVTDCQALVDAAAAAGRVLQVGHVERFNPALATAGPKLTEPKYIEARRFSGYTFRSTDVGVVLDLMIHDLDIILSLMNSEVADVDALGVSVMSQFEDAATARLQFANGCIANVSASRISYEPTRSMQIWTPQRFASLNFADGTAKVVEPHADLTQGTFDGDTLSPSEKEHYRDTLFESLLPIEHLDALEVNAIADEQADFVHAIQTETRPRVTGEAGRDAVVLAERILAAFESHNWDGREGGRAGAHGMESHAVISAPHFLSHPKKRREAG